MKNLCKFTLAMVFSISIFAVKSAIGADAVRPYGNLYIFFGYVESETYNAAEKNNFDNDILYKINNNSNLGFTFDYKKYSGVFELGIDDYENERKVKIRKAYGAYRLDIGELQIGLSWAPYVKWSHEAANYYRSEGFGALYEEPYTQIKFTTGIGLYIDIIKPNITTQKFHTQQEIDNPSNPTTTEYKLIEVEREVTTGQPLGNIKAMIPKTAIGYEYQSKKIKFGFGAAFNTYYIDKTDVIEFDKNWIISYLFFANSNLNLGGFLINLSAGYIVNPANYGISVQSQGSETYYPGAAAAIHNIDSGKYEIKDTWNVQGYLEIGYQISSSSRIYAGYGFSLVDYPMDEALGDSTVRDYAMEYYLNIKFNIGGLIALTPSISYRDYMKSLEDKDEGKEINGGVLATVSFY